MEMQMNKNKKTSAKSSKVDVESRFSESDLEYVSEDDSRQMLHSFDSYHEYTSERNSE
jgi:hypothetical protein